MKFSTNMLVVSLLLGAAAVSCKTRDFHDNKGAEAKGSGFSATSQKWLGVFGKDVQTFMYHIPNEALNGQCWYRVDTDPIFGPAAYVGLFPKAKSLSTHYVSSQVLVSEFRKRPILNTAIENVQYELSRPKGALNGVGIGIGGCVVGTIMMAADTGNPAWLGGILVSPLCGIAGAAYGFVKPGTPPLEKFAQEVKTIQSELNEQTANEFVQLDYKFIEELSSAVKAASKKGSTSEPCPAPTRELLAKAQERMTIKAPAN